MVNLNRHRVVNLTGICTLTKEAYEYNRALIQQFRTDGGGYSPSPASPPTNLDNGALGFFRTSAVNRVDFKAVRN